jgi:hypothetical protein
MPTAGQTNKTGQPIAVPFYFMRGLFPLRGQDHRQSTTARIRVRFAPFGIAARSAANIPNPGVVKIVSHSRFIQIYRCKMIRLVV